MKKISDFQAFLFSLLLIMFIATAGTVIMPIAQLLMPNWQVSNAVSNDIVDGDTVEAVFSNMDVNVKTVVTNTGSDLFYSISNPSNYISELSYYGFFHRAYLLPDQDVTAIDTLWTATSPPQSSTILNVNEGDIPLTGVFSMNTTGSDYDTSTGIFTPSVAGYYLLTGGGIVWNFDDDGTVAPIVLFFLYDDNAGIQHPYTIFRGNGQPNDGGGGSIIQYFDGVDDRVMLRIYADQSTGTFEPTDYKLNSYYFGASFQGSAP